MKIIQILKQLFELWALIGDDLIEIHTKLITAIKAEKEREAIAKDKENGDETDANKTKTEE